MMLRKSLIVSSLLMLFLSSCATLEPPEYRTLTNFSVKNLSNQPEFSCDVKMYNPNHLGMKIKDYTFDISVANLSITSVHSVEVTKAPPNAEFLIPVNGTLALSQIPALVSAGVQSLSSGNKVPV